MRYGAQTPKGHPPNEAMIADAIVFMQGKFRMQNRDSTHVEEITDRKFKSSVVP
jgi:hypothetical protein